MTKSEKQMIEYGQTVKNIKLIEKNAAAMDVTEELYYYLRDIMVKEGGLDPNSLVGDGEANVAF